MNAHEKICFRNPNRFCDLCKNTGKTIIDAPIDGTYYEPCFYCSKFNPKQLEEIEAREKGERKNESVEEVKDLIDQKDIPF